MDRRTDVTDVNSGAAPSAGLAAMVTPKAAAPNAEPNQTASTGPSPLDMPSPVTPAVGTVFACGQCGCVIRLEAPSRIRPHQLKPFGCQCGAKMHEAPKGDVGA